MTPARRAGRAHHHAAPETSIRSPDFALSMPVPNNQAPTRQLSPTLVVEDHGTEFFLVSRGEGHDITLSLDADVAVELSHFLSERLRLVSR